MRYYRHYYSFNLAVCILLALFAVSCASFQRNTYRTLSIAKETYDVSMKSAADLYKQGKINDRQKTEIIRVGNEYRAAYFVAVDALVAYAATDASDDKEKLQTAMTEFAKVSRSFTQLLQKYVE
jgi:hypothetical protein